MNGTNDNNPDLPAPAPFRENTGTGRFAVPHMGIRKARYGHLVMGTGNRHTDNALMAGPKPLNPVIETAGTDSVDPPTPPVA